tara:strand:+ start:905 stop:1297 length:393 start_codon:yes stop_codon:yes gene_type:complete
MKSIFNWGTVELESMLNEYADNTRKLPVGKMVNVVKGNKNEATEDYLQDALDKIARTFQSEIEESIRSYLWDGFYENSHVITEDLIRLGYFKETSKQDIKEETKYVEESERRPYTKKSKFWKDKYQSNKI